MSPFVTHESGSILWAQHAAYPWPVPTHCMEASEACEVDRPTPCTCGSQEDIGTAHVPGQWRPGHKHARNRRRTADSTGRLGCKL